MSFYTKWLKLAKTSSPNYLRKMWMNISIAQLYVVQNVPYVHEYFLDINKHSRLMIEPHRILNVMWPLLDNFKRMAFLQNTK